MNKASKIALIVIFSVMCFPALCFGQITVEYLNGSIITTKDQKKPESSLKYIFGDNEANVSDNTKRLGWVRLASKQRARVAEIRQYAAEVGKNFDDVIVTGIGGSSLGAKSLIHALTPAKFNEMTKEERNGAPRMHFIENIDPDTMAEVTKGLNWNKTLLIVVSSSGTVPETSANYLHIKEILKNNLGKAYSQHIVAITKDSKDSVLYNDAKNNGFKVFVTPDGFESRFSMYSDSAMVPAAIAGVDIGKFLDGVHDMTENCRKTYTDLQGKTPQQKTAILKNDPVVNLALIHQKLYHQGKEYTAMMPYSDKLSGYTDWFAQIWAESLGKAEDKQGHLRHTNYSPLKALGAIDQHSQTQLYLGGKGDKIIDIITVGQFNNPALLITHETELHQKLDYLRGRTFNEQMEAESRSTMETLVRKDRPVVHITLPKVDAYSLGQLYQATMLEVGLIGHMEGIEPYNQPEVNAGKERTKEIMREMGKKP